jgi:ABC-type multidrug transport system permease subunit
MLSKLVINLYTALLEIGLWLMLVMGFIGGWASGGFFGALFGLIASAIFGAVFFGAFLVLNDIRARVKVIEDRNRP